MLEIDDSITFMLDLVVITFVYAEARRRATVASRNASAASASSAASAILQGLADELIPSAAPTSRQILKGIIDQCGWIINSEYCCFG